MPKIDEKKIVLILAFLHLAIALPLAWKLNIWADEASTLYTTQNGFFQAFDNLFHDEKQAPIYFLLLSLWRKINDSVFFARLFSIICSLLAIFSFSRLARKIWEEKTAIFITAIFALHPYLFFASLEIRLYSLIILITCLLFTFFYDGYLRKDSPNKKAQFFYVLTAIFALYTNYYLGFFLVGGFVALLLLRRFDAAKTYFWQMLGVGVAILPLFYIINLQFSVRVTTTFQAEKSLIVGMKILWNHFLTFVLPTELYPSEEATMFSFVRVWLIRIAILSIAVVLIKNKFRQVDKNVIVSGAISAVSALFFLFVYFQLGAGYIEIRHASVFFVAVFLFFSLILTKILPGKSWVFVAFLYSIFFSYSIYAMHPNLTKRGDWARVAEFISQTETPNQPIIIFPTYDSIALPNYYKGANKILPTEKIFSFFPEDKMGSPNAYRNQIDFIIEQFPREAEEVWLLTDGNCEIERSCEPLENFVKANYTIIQEKDFYEEKVRLLRKKKND